MSLFRGIAEGITHGAVNYTGFPPHFLALGQGYLGGVVPAQLPIFVAVLVGYVVLLHRSVIGRALYAIGFSPDGARYAGIPVSAAHRPRLPAVRGRVEQAPVSSTSRTSARPVRTPAPATS